MRWDKEEGGGTVEERKKMRYGGGRWDSRREEGDVAKGTEEIDGTVGERKVMGKEKEDKTAGERKKVE